MNFNIDKLLKNISEQDDYKGLTLPELSCSDKFEFILNVVVNDNFGLFVTEDFIDSISFEELDEIGNYIENILSSGILDFHENEVFQISRVIKNLKDCTSNVIPDTKLLF